MTHLPDILLIWAIYLASAMSPGPNVFVISNTALARSRRSGIATALGVSTGTLIYSTATVAGLSALIAGLSYATGVLRYGGAAYLIYLRLRTAVRAWRGGGRVEAPRIAPGGSVRAYASGLLTNLSNPKSLVFYLSLMSLIVEPETPLWARATAGAGIAALSVVWYGAVAVAFSSAHFRRGYARAARWVDAGFGCALLGAGVRLAVAPLASSGARGW